MTADSPTPLLHWENPEPGVYEATLGPPDRVALEVYEANPEDEADHFVWWAFVKGVMVGTGEAVGLDVAKAACEKAAA